MNNLEALVLRKEQDIKRGSHFGKLVEAAVRNPAQYEKMRNTTHPTPPRSIHDLCEIVRDGNPKCRELVIECIDNPSCIPEKIEFYKEAWQTAYGRVFIRALIELSRYMSIAPKMNSFEKLQRRGDRHLSNETVWH